MIDPETMDRTDVGATEPVDSVSKGKGWRSRARHDGATPAPPAKDAPEASAPEGEAVDGPAEVDEEAESGDAWDNA
ncbi:MAG: hypothetical protein ACRDIY_15465, partial [Chloroflexota bacterium]